jgi:Ca2+-transporting ATPase
MEDKNPFLFSGLTENEVGVSRRVHGSNTVESRSEHASLRILKETISDPMLILLAAATIIYFISGEISDALFMAAAIIFISAISVYQTNRSLNALRALKEFAVPNALVIRDSRPAYIPVGEIVVGDYVVVSEGERAPADGIAKQLNDFSVNESILTGEAFSVTKDISSKESNKIYKGTLVESGQCVFEVIAVGNKTKFGELEASVRGIRKAKSPLQRQIRSFVKWMSLGGAGFFLVIWGINYVQSENILDSLLKGLTIAMSVLPEEIPVAFISFMALGAWRLMKKGIIVKDPSIVEALGAATVICLDKTGTITENKMDIYQIYDFENDRIVSEVNPEDASVCNLISTAMWASETVPFDNMEKAILKAYEECAAKDRRPSFRKIYEYPLDGKPPMMTHIFENDEGERIIAMKGAPEAILKISLLIEDDRQKVGKYLSLFAKEGLRVLGVGSAVFEGTNFPETQQEFNVRFSGLIGFYDPPKKNIKKIFEQFYLAGIRLKIITGDNPATTIAIAGQAGVREYEKALTSAELVGLNETEFDKAVIENNLFTRMFPEVKLKVIQSLKRQHQIVAMTGDGVNDGPALKAADIGISMGKRGSEIAKEASSLILTDDDIGKMTDALAMGRKIYTNLKKAIQYIISIHIPIILTVALPLILDWTYPVVFTPVHVIFLELVMGPTCSVVYENEPAEKNSMLQKPRVITATFFNKNELVLSIFQGLAITAGVLTVYSLSLQNGYGESLTRSMVFTTLIIANIFLTFVNRSFYYSVFTTFRYKNNLLWVVILTTLILLAMTLYIPSFSNFFMVAPLTPVQISSAVVTALISVSWIELWKMRKRSLTNPSPILSIEKNNP